MNKKDTTTWGENGLGKNRASVSAMVVRSEVRVSPRGVARAQGVGHGHHIGAPSVTDGP